MRIIKVQKNDVLNLMEHLEFENKYKSVLKMGSKIDLENLFSSCGNLNIPSAEVVFEEVKTKGDSLTFLTHKVNSKNKVLENLRYTTHLKLSENKDAANPTIQILESSIYNSSDYRLLTMLHTFMESVKTSYLTTKDLEDNIIKCVETVKLMDSDTQGKQVNMKYILHESINVQYKKGSNIENKILLIESFNKNKYAISFESHKISNNIDNKVFLKNLYVIKENNTFKEAKLSAYAQSIMNQALQMLDYDKKARVNVSTIDDIDKIKNEINKNTKYIATYDQNRDEMIITKESRSITLSEVKKICGAIKVYESDNIGKPLRMLNRFKECVTNSKNKGKITRFRETSLEFLSPETYDLMVGIDKGFKPGDCVEIPIEKVYNVMETMDEIGKYTEYNVSLDGNMEKLMITRESMSSFTEAKSDDILADLRKPQMLKWFKDNIVLLIENDYKYYQILMKYIDARAEGKNEASAKRALISAITEAGYDALSSNYEGSRPTIIKALKQAIPNLNNFNDAITKELVSMYEYRQFMNRIKEGITNVLDIKPMLKETIRIMPKKGVIRFEKKDIRQWKTFKEALKTVVKNLNKGQYTYGYKVFTDSIIFVKNREGLRKSTKYNIS